MALILSLETSTDVCSVALHQNGTLIQDFLIDQPQSHASRLAVLITGLFKTTGLNPENLNAVAITSGPGSYTGLRIGTSTAKGLCYALNIPLIAISTLKLLAFQGKQRFNHGILCPMIDARRMEVYTQQFNALLEPLSEIQPMIIDHLSFQELLATEKVFFIGNGAEKCKSVILNSNAVFDSIAPTASALGQLAHGSFLENSFQDVTTFEPFYLKQFIAKKASSALG